MSKQTEALKLALEGLEKWHFDKDPRGADQYITAIREALAEQPAQGCEFCSHPLYAGTKCKNCKREQPAQQEPKIGCVNHDCDKCKAQQQEPVAWMKDCADFWEHYTYISEASQENYKAEAQMWVEKLRTSPPASKPLTDEEIDACWYQSGGLSLKFARAIEAKLREKNA